MASDFVILGDNIPAISGYQSLLLNILEMFGCLIFQTLDPKDLKKYLPETMELFLPCCGLNIALPLWQSASNGMAMGVCMQLGPVFCRRLLIPMEAKFQNHHSTLCISKPITNL